MIRPIKNQVLIKLFQGDDKSTGGIIVSEAHRAESNKGRVVAGGLGTKDKPMQFKEGDIVYRVQNHGEQIEIDGDKYYIMDQSTILAKE